MYFPFSHTKGITYQEALLFAGGIFLLNGLQALTSSQYYVIAYHNAMKVRVAICGLMYRKVRNELIHSIGDIIALITSIKFYDF